MYEILILILIFVDQSSKFYITHNFSLGASEPVIDGFFNLTRVHNFGAAFGLFQGRQYIFAVIAFVTVVIGIIYIHRVRSKVAKIAVSLLVSGAIGNLIDRIRLGFVVDFLDFHGIWKYIFNIADVFVVVGAILLCVYVAVDEKRKG